jgi:hypothetical protein
MVVISTKDMYKIVVVLINFGRCPYGMLQMIIVFQIVNIIFNVVMVKYNHLIE